MRVAALVAVAIGASSSGLEINNNSTDATIEETPATAYFPIDDNREPAQGLYNDASVVSMLNSFGGIRDLSLAFSSIRGINTKKSNIFHYALSKLF